MPTIERVYEGFLRLAVDPRAIQRRSFRRIVRDFGQLLDSLAGVFSTKPFETLNRLGNVEKKLSEELELDVHRAFFRLFRESELRLAYRSALQIEKRFAHSLQEIGRLEISNEQLRGVSLDARHALFLCWQADKVTRPLAEELALFATHTEHFPTRVGPEIVRAIGPELLYVQIKGPRMVNLIGRASRVQVDPPDVDMLLAEIAQNRAELQESVVNGSLDLLGYQIGLISKQQRALLSEIDALETDLKGWSDWARSLNLSISGEPGKRPM